MFILKYIDVYKFILWVRVFTNMYFDGKNYLYERGYLATCENNTTYQIRFDLSLNIERKNEQIYNS